MYVGLIVVFMGVLFLMKNTGLISGDIWPIIWPLLIILLGISILAKAVKFHRRFGIINQMFHSFWKR
ncbi:MAG: DUF5668 domain-containing protein [bacterium]|nr:DUF5668 domain-containing protein [bacterium]